MTTEEFRYKRAISDWMIATINLTNAVPRMRDRSEEVWEAELEEPLKAEFEETVMLAKEHQRDNDSSMMGSMFRILAAFLQDAGRRLEKDLD